MPQVDIESHDQKTPGQSPSKKEQHSHAESYFCMAKSLNNQMGHLGMSTSLMGLKSATRRHIEPVKK
jgi:hypothetical protein